MKSVIDFLQTSGFYKDEYAYRAASDTIALAIYINMEPEKEDFWTDGPPEVVWFTPLTQIALESRHTRESHEMSYRMARELAKLLGGVIYDNQIGVVYDSDGTPFDHCRTGDQFDKYGSGMDLFTRGIGLFKDMLDSKQ
jgi:hypothetical protein